MLSNSICCAQDITEYLDGRAVNVIETDDEINIYMLISMTGDASMYMLPHTAVTYEKAFYRGVEQMWEGSYMDKDVNIIIEKTGADDERKHIKVIFDRVKNADSFSCASKAENTIWIYSGDGRSVFSIFYDYQWFVYTSGHEMGHQLGLADAYSDKNELVRTSLKTPMNYISTPHAQEVDYYIMLKHRTWENDYVYNYSDDMEGISKYLSD